MSLEAALQANTEAVNRLAAIMAGGALSAGMIGDTPAEKPAPKAKTPAKEPAAKVEPETPKTEAKAEAVSYDKQVAPAITKVAGTCGREKALAILGKFNVKNGKELQAEQYADVLKACEAALAEVA